MPLIACCTMTVVMARPPPPPLPLPSLPRLRGREGRGQAPCPRCRDSSHLHLATLSDRVGTARNEISALPIRTGRAFAHPTVQHTSPPLNSRAAPSRRGRP